MPWRFIEEQVAIRWHTTPMVVQEAPIDTVMETLKILELEAQAQPPPPNRPR